MWLRSTSILAASILILGACGSEGSSNIAVGDGGAKNLGEQEFERVLTKYSYQCNEGSNTIRFAPFDATNTPEGVTLYEISNVSFTVVEHELTAAEKLNGYEFKGHIVFSDQTAARNLVPGRTWTDWSEISTNGFGGAPKNNLHLKDGQWERHGEEWTDGGWRLIDHLFSSDREYIMRRDFCD